MTRGQRRAHFAIWLLLAPALLAAIGWALATRQVPVQAASAPLERSP